MNKDLEKLLETLFVDDEGEDIQILLTSKPFEVTWWGCCTYSYAAYE